MFGSDPRSLSSGFPLVQLELQGCVPWLSLGLLHHDPLTENYVAQNQAHWFPSFAASGVFLGVILGNRGVPSKIL